MDFSKDFVHAEEKSKLEFDGFWDWLVSYNDPFALWQAQPTYIYTQLLVLTGAIITFYHAAKNGGRFMHLWIGIILHGTFIEIISYNFPNIDNFWHSQSPVIFFGRRLPFYIILIYAVFIYPATIAVDALHLKKWAEPLAVGLVTVLIDYPYDLIGVRFMFWTWHDTDPNISDKHYHVPWNSFYFHATFAASFIFCFHFTRLIALGKTKKWKNSDFFLKELICTLLASILGMPGGVLLFIPLYHPLHDIWKIHTEVIVFLLFTIFVCIIWVSISKNSKTEKNNINKTSNRIIALYLFFYYLFFIGVAIFINPASEFSVGYHEPIGPCNESVSITTALGQTLYKRKYFCLTDNDETYFGWSCLINEMPPAIGAKWYTICGTPFTNRTEYIVILTTVALFGFSFFFKTLYICDPLYKKLKKAKINKNEINKK